MDAVRKVLVVDDDPVVAKSFERVLSGKGYAVITAADGEEALNKLRSEDYDVVFTDIKMPGMNGLEVAERVKASQPWLPVVIVTGYGTDANEARAEAAGVAGFLRKPLSPEMIESSARAALYEITPAVAPEVIVETPAVAPPARVERSFAGSVALMLAAPFIGLAFVLTAPFIGFAVLAAIAGRELGRYATMRKVGRVARNVGLFIAAPFVGLAYAIAFPFVGLAMLAWMGVRALKK